ncbi:MAG: DUF5007 domain-containing protein [Odoribacteraceae bacterium]|jgi:hypothetical protein|nr:DUF5007 domain-containing protein [Odoribacteraceae bacterium]
MKKEILLFGLLAAGIAACDQIEEGYLSTNVHYAQNPLEVSQGTVMFSEALAADNSTSPLRVELLDIRDVRTGQHAASWYGESEVSFWLDEINSATDTTWEQVLAKYSRKPYPIFQVNPVGGRLEFTEGTSEIPLGEYEIDVKVSNVRGSMILKNACTIILGEKANFFGVAGAYDLWNTSNSDTRLDPKIDYRELEGSDLDAFKATLSAAGETYDPDYGYMILKVLDNYGNAFDWTPSTDPISGGEIRQRNSSGVEQRNYERRSPWQKMIYTDDALIAPFPMAPFPLINAPDAPSDEIAYYRIVPTATNKGVDIWLRFSWEILRKGVFEVTYQLLGADDTGLVERLRRR